MEYVGYGSLFDAPEAAKKLHTPPVESKKEDVNPPHHTNAEWFDGTVIEKSSNSPIHHVMKDDNWMLGGGVGKSSPDHVVHPGQIKIEGYHSSVKDNPFLKT